MRSVSLRENVGEGGQRYSALSLCVYRYHIAREYDVSVSVAGRAQDELVNSGRRATSHGEDRNGW
jgi:hypothetical protein